MVHYEMASFFFLSPCLFVSDVLISVAEFHVRHEVLDTLFLTLFTNQQHIIRLCHDIIFESLQNNQLVFTHRHNVVRAFYK